MIIRRPDLHGRWTERVELFASYGGEDFVFQAKATWALGHLSLYADASDIDVEVSRFRIDGPGTEWRAFDDSPLSNDQALFDALRYSAFELIHGVECDWKQEQREGCA